MVAITAKPVRLAAIALIACVLGVACGSGAPAPAAAPAQPGGAQPNDWAAVLAAAQREGVVVCGCPPRPDFTRVIKEGFEAAHPGIRLDATAAPLPEFFVRIEKEQGTGLYLWDIYMFGVSLEMFPLRDQDAFECTRSYRAGPDWAPVAARQGGLTD